MPAEPKSSRVARGCEPKASNRGAERRAVHKEAINIEPCTVAREAYFRQGVALQYLGRHADALAAFASGLAQDPKSLQLLLHIIRGVVQSSSSETRGERLQNELIRAYSLSITNEHRVALESLFPKLQTSLLIARVVSGENRPARCQTGASSFCFAWQSLSVEEREIGIQRLVIKALRSGDATGRTSTSVVLFIAPVSVVN
ncbi:Tetratricopeptide repeat protein 28 [Triplophysa tibetana]|uniref:Tetratricopeptide repeat protein 28 n=1 Tax=Triplophysa tibetana TaxID=1572043 RepID=A0A5A9N4K9_9TELE|nr:Tetratricopeptide repeat protein 28 [Triplophysa tibetana]